MSHHSLNDYKTELNGRTLWFDGDLTVAPEKLVDMIQRGVEPRNLFVTEITKDIEQYNKLTRNNISVKTNVRGFDLNWNVRNDFVNPEALNLEDYLINKLIDNVENQQFTETEQKIRIRRLFSELELYRKRGLDTILRVIIFVINTLEHNNIVWGIGRGSSVSSYILYLIGAHDVDSVEYNLDISDFIQ